MLFRSQKSHNKLRTILKLLIPIDQVNDVDKNICSTQCCSCNKSKGCVAPNKVIEPERVVLGKRCYEA